MSEGEALWLAGGPAAFRAADILIRAEDEILVARMTVAQLLELDEPTDVCVALADRLGLISGTRAPILDLDWDASPHLMGIVNVTPDSFSDGGDHADASAGAAHGRALGSAGAVVLDIGGESTRPGSDPVSVEEEIARTQPVVAALASDHIVSIDTRNAPVMKTAIEAGARLINDVSALTHDPRALSVVAETGLPVALMHMGGKPKTMQDDPSYDHAALDVFDRLEERVLACETAGITRDRILIDPGFGFGKTVAHNMTITNMLTLFHGLGCPILFGASRKSSIASLSRGEAAKDRVPGSVALALAAAERGVQMIRIHDVAETAQAIAVWRGLSAD